MKKKICMSAKTFISVFLWCILQQLSNCCGRETPILPTVFRLMGREADNLTIKIKLFRNPEEGEASQGAVMPVIIIIIIIQTDEQRHPLLLM
jgi:hypothetical protein